MIMLVNRFVMEQLAGRSWIDVGQYKEAELWLDNVMVSGWQAGRGIGYGCLRLQATGHG